MSFMSNGEYVPDHYHVEGVLIVPDVDECEEDDHDLDDQFAGECVEDAIYDRWQDAQVDAGYEHWFGDR